MNTLNRRQFIKLTGLLTAGAAGAGCSAADFLDRSPSITAWPPATAEADWRLLNRITFGPRPAERQRLAEIGPAAFIEEQLEEQLAPEMLPEMAAGPWLTLRRRETLHLDAPDLFDVEAEIVKRELQQAALLRAIYSPRQLYEVMVDFWTNHFHIDQNKAVCAWLKTVDDREVIRPHALGHFHDLLSASAHSPAMLVYLDNQENHAGNPNENYARELLELHTLGVDGGYSQQDVREVARCLTGWSVKAHFYRGQFTFDEEQHDPGSKQVLGLPIPANLGQAGGQRVIEMLATHPATARFIATKLVRRFIADDPPSALVEKAAHTFLKTDGDIKAVLRTILLSEQMLNPLSLGLGPQPKLKRPLDYVASALRQLDARTDGGDILHTVLARLGQPLFQWPTPDGFPDRAEAWQGGLMTRWRFAVALANDEIEGTTLDLAGLATLAEAQGGREAGEIATLFDQFATLLLGHPLPATVANQLLAADPRPRMLLASLLSAPAFQWK